MIAKTWFRLNDHVGTPVGQSEVAVVEIGMMHAPAEVLIYLWIMWYDSNLANPQAQIVWKVTSLATAELIAPNRVA